MAQEDRNSLTPNIDLPVAPLSNSAEAASPPPSIPLEPPDRLPIILGGISIILSIIAIVLAFALRSTTASSENDSQTITALMQAMGTIAANQTEAPPEMQVSLPAALSEADAATLIDQAVNQAIATMEARLSVTMTAVAANSPAGDTPPTTNPAPPDITVNEPTAEPTADSDADTSAIPDNQSNAISSNDSASGTNGTSEVTPIQVEMAAQSPVYAGDLRGKVIEFQGLSEAGVTSTRVTASAGLLIQDGSNSERPCENQSNSNPLIISGTRLLFCPIFDGDAPQNVTLTIVGNAAENTQPRVEQTFTLPITQPTLTLELNQYNGEVPPCAPANIREFTYIPFSLTLTSPSGVIGSYPTTLTFDLQNAPSSLWMIPSDTCPNEKSSLEAVGSFGFEIGQRYNFAVEPNLDASTPPNEASLPLITVSGSANFQPTTLQLQPIAIVIQPDQILLQPRREGRLTVFDTPFPIEIKSVFVLDGYTDQAGEDRQSQYFHTQFGWIPWDDRPNSFRIVGDTESLPEIPLMPPPPTATPSP